MSFTVFLFVACSKTNINDNKLSISDESKTINSTNSSSIESSIGNTKVNNGGSLSQDIPQNIILDNEIKTKEYSICVPKEWTVEKLPSGTLHFKKEDEEIGGLYPQPYYSDLKDPLAHLLPNHSEIVERKKLEGLFTEAEEIKINQDNDTIASGVSGTSDWIHVFLIKKDKKIAYEIFFNTKFLNENEVLKIVKSFKLVS